MIKAIETEYKGYKFRSRLEARWAVFFDSLGWKWEYEKEGFILEDGTRYLPDFYLPEIKTWVEVKSESIAIEDRRRCALLSKGIKDQQFVVLASGLPEPKGLETYYQGFQCNECTLTSYIRKKDWGSPYFGDFWDEEDMMAFIKAKQARFEFLS